MSHPNDQRPPARPNPRRHVDTRRGIGPTQSPELREFSDDVGAVELIDGYESKLREAIRQPLPGPASVPKVEDAGTPSFRPGRELVATAIRRVDPRWLGVALVLFVIIWALGGPSGVRELVAAWRASQFTNEIAGLNKRISELETRTGNLEAALARRDKNDIKFRSDTSQIVGRLGVRWMLPDGTPPQRPLEFVTPLRAPGQVKGGPSVVVVQPVPMPEASP